ncbi:MAG: peptidase S9 [Phycisphaeraceae bacterium]|nr:MAG: peptidase S9 [Phycisphaeraceae bacterium]
MNTRRFAALGSIALAMNASPALASDPDIATYLKVRTPGTPDVAPDGSLYMRDWPDGVYQLYRRDAGESPHSQGTQLTQFEDGISGFTVSPDGSKLVIDASIGGSEQDDLFLLDPITREITTLHSDPKVVYDHDAWLRDGSGFIYHANDESSTDFHLYLHDLTTGAARKILAEPGYWYAFDVTDDGSRAIVGRYVSASSAEVYELDLATGELLDLSFRDESGDAYYNSAVGYLPGEQSLVMVSDFDDGIRQAIVRDIRTRRAPRPVPGLGRWDVSGAVMNHDRRLLAIGTNEDGYGRVHAYSLPAMRKIELPDLPEGVVTVGDLEGTTLVYRVSSAQQPNISYTLDLSKTHVKPVAITAVDDQGLNLDGFIEPSLIKYTTFDGLEIPAFLYLPEGRAADEPIPFIVWYHGGPEGQHRPTFSATRQYFVDAGFGILRPNVRGSTGYGRAFHQLDNYKNRWDSVKDGVAAARFLVDNGYAEHGKIAAMGGSYGGFMAAAVPIEDTRQADERAEPNLFGAAVNTVGIVNFKTFLERTGDYRRKLREAEYGPLTDPDFLNSVSPLAHLDEYRIPFLIAHGLNDPRVPIDEAIQLAEGLQRAGVQPRQVYFHDEGHGFAKLENRLHYYAQVVDFLEQEIGD